MKLIQIGNQTTNLELLTNAHFLPKNSEVNRSVLLLYFANSASGIQLYNDEAERFWAYLHSSSFDITPVRPATEEVIA